VPWGLQRTEEIGVFIWEISTFLNAARISIHQSGAGQGSFYLQSDQLQF